MSTEAGFDGTSLGAGQEPDKVEDAKVRLTQALTMVSPFTGPIIDAPGRASGMGTASLSSWLCCDTTIQAMRRRAPVGSVLLV